MIGHDIVHAPVGIDVFQHVERDRHAVQASHTQPLPCGQALLATDSALKAATEIECLCSEGHGSQTMESSAAAQELLKTHRTHEEKALHPAWVTLGVQRAQQRAH